MRIPPGVHQDGLATHVVTTEPRGVERAPLALDRKSTRLNSSHGYISYAAFCLKTKVELIGIFLDYTPVALREMQTATAPYYTESLALIAHSRRGSDSSVGANRLA